MEFPTNNAEAAPGQDEFWAFNPQQPPQMAGAQGEETSLDDLLAYFQTPQDGTAAPAPDAFGAPGADAFPPFPPFDAAPAAPAADAFGSFDAGSDAFAFDAGSDAFAFDTGGDAPFAAFDAAPAPAPAFDAPPAFGAPAAAKLPPLGPEPEAFSPFPAGPAAPSADDLFDFAPPAGGDSAAFDPFAAPGANAAPAAPAFDAAPPALTEEPEEFVWEDDLSGGPVFPPLEEAAPAPAFAPPAAPPAPPAAAAPAPPAPAAFQEPEEFVWEDDLSGGPVFPPLEEAAPAPAFAPPAAPAAPPAAAAPPAPAPAPPSAPQPVAQAPAPVPPPVAAPAPPPQPPAPPQPQAQPQPVAQAPVAPPVAPAPAPAPRPMPQAADPDATLRYRELPGEAQALNVPIETVAASELTGKEVVIRTPDERRVANQELTQVVGALAAGLDNVQGQMANHYAELQRAAVRRAPVEDIQKITADLTATKAAVSEGSELYQQALYLRQVADAYLRLLNEL